MFMGLIFFCFSDFEVINYVVQNNEKSEILLSSDRNSSQMNDCDTTVSTAMKLKMLLWYLLKYT